MKRALTNDCADGRRDFLLLLKVWGGEASGDLKVTRDQLGEGGGFVLSVRFRGFLILPGGWKRQQRKDHALFSLLSL